MNSDVMIDRIVEAYMDSLMCESLEDWIENILRYGRKDKGLEKLTDEELKKQYDEWVGEDEETDAEDNA